MGRSGLGTRDSEDFSGSAGEAKWASGKGTFGGKTPEIGERVTVCRKEGRKEGSRSMVGYRAVSSEQ
jgi:hypothetical protein